VNKNRLEAFSDGVMAVIITIMVLSIKIPHGTNFAALKPLIPIFVTYILSFILVGIYWANHHHLFQAVDHINGAVLWANLHLLFWLSLYPFVTAYIGENKFSSVPVAVYGTVGFFAALAYFILTKALLSGNTTNIVLKKAIGGDFKGKLSTFLTIIAIPLAFVSPYISFVLYFLVAAIWIVPDRSIEKTILEIEDKK
jgi:uncharacterized membrane protein